MQCPSVRIAIQIASDPNPSQSILKQSEGEKCIQIPQLNCLSNTNSAINSPITSVDLLCDGEFYKQYEYDTLIPFNSCEKELATEVILKPLLNEMVKAEGKECILMTYG
jgi:hypothetical protein